MKVCTSILVSNVNIKLVFLHVFLYLMLSKIFLCNIGVKSRKRVGNPMAASTPYISKSKISH